MVKWAQGTCRFVGSYWERIIFALVGLLCLGLTTRLLIRDDITRASAVFAIAVFSFFYSNLARFKRFKGLGFEAELWEDKQKEAADLIDRLKNVVAVYTREIVMSSVTRGRLGSADSWERRFALFDELASKHGELGQNIDFEPLKREMVRYLVFDICLYISASVGKSIENAKAKAQNIIGLEHGHPIMDADGYNAKNRTLATIRATLDGELFDHVDNENLARELLTLIEDARENLRKHWNIDLELNETAVTRLNRLAKLLDERQIAVSPELLEWGTDREAYRDV